MSDLTLVSFVVVVVVVAVVVVGLAPDAYRVTHGPPCAVSKPCGSATCLTLGKMRSMMLTANRSPFFITPFLLTIVACSSGSSSDSSGAGTSGGSVAGATPAAAAGRTAGAAGTTRAAGTGASPAPSPAGRASPPAGGTGASTGAAGRAGAAGSPEAGKGGSLAGAAGTTGASAGASANIEKFSFFVTSLKGMQQVSGKDVGFGGDLTHGMPDGLSGADKICTEIAELSMPGSGAKGWHAFLSVAKDQTGAVVNAIDRVGAGPWYDRRGRLVAMSKAALASERPQGADTAIRDDLPNEDGVPNKQPDASQPAVDNHHVLTGSDASGKLYQSKVDGTCVNWTSTAKSALRPRVGFSWVADSRTNWISGQDEGGCGAGVSLDENGGSDPSNPIVGSGGGYGAIYCFALTP